MFLAIVTSLVLSASLLTLNVAQPVKADNCDEAHLSHDENANVKGNAGCLTRNTGNTGIDTTCVKWSDEHLTVIDLSCNSNTNIKTVSNYVARGYEIKATIGLTMILTK